MVDKLINMYPDYDFSISNYMNVRTPINIICKKHGIFNKKPCLMLYNNQGCPKCGLEMKKNKLTNDFTDLVKRFHKIHNNKYSYKNSKYILNNIKIDILCQEHGIFKQRPDNHLSGQGCPKCSVKSMSLKKTYSLKKFINKSSITHNHKYTYKDSEYINSVTHLTITCPVHGNFSQKPVFHINGSGCPKCNYSKGESKIEEILNENKIKFIPQYKFNDCIHKEKLRFDFYLTELNTVIEFDGEQHFEVKEHWGGEKEFNNIKMRDYIKNKYCINNNIKIIRIPYWEKNIRDFLMEKLDKLL